MGKGARKKDRRKKKRKRESLARRADRHDLYQRSVQSPDVDIEFFLEVFRELRGREPSRLREDFCGTGYLSAEWARGGPDRTAVGVDHDPETLAWGREHNLTDPAVATRVELIEADVRRARTRKADLTCALNFSFWVFKRRDELLDYFRAARRGLVDDGVLFTELYGGTEAIIELEERREVEDFWIVWHQRRFNPISHETLCHIHFEFADGSQLKKAFTYDWRMWSIPEVRELLAEAGFAETRVYWGEVDDDGEDTGEYLLSEEEENQETWLAYVVATR